MTSRALSDRYSSRPPDRHIALLEICKIPGMEGPPQFRLTPIPLKVYTRVARSSL